MSDLVETRVTVADAKAAALRLINSHFRNDDQARMHIPAREEDDDLLLMRFITQHAELPAFPIERLKERLIRVKARTNRNNISELYDGKLLAFEEVSEIIAELEAEVKEGK